MIRGAHRGLTNGRWRLLSIGLMLTGAACLQVGVTGEPVVSDDGAVTALDAPVPAPLPVQASTGETRNQTMMPTSPGPAGSSASPGAETPTTRSADVGPRTLRIPAIEVSTALIRLGQQAGGEVEVPADPDRAGWFDLGPVPGDLGSSVILGHVDSIDGPAVFADLGTLRQGQRVTVSLEDGSVAVFGVQSVRLYANEDFPAQDVYGSQDRRELNLVTCGGAYDAARGGYQANVVVNARWLRTRGQAGTNHPRR